MKSAKRIRRSADDAKLLILRTAETIMREQGYAAVTVRGVAKAAGLSSTLLHYYFPTADDLLVALYRHVSALDLTLLQAALSAPDPVMALWDYQTDAQRTGLGVEFLALANHRKVIHHEIARFAEGARNLQAETLADFFKRTGVSPGCTPVCLSMLLTSVSRNLIMESSVGISSGHTQARRYIKRALKELKRGRKQTQ